MYAGLTAIQSGKYTAVLTTNLCRIFAVFQTRGSICGAVVSLLICINSSLLTSWSQLYAMSDVVRYGKRHTGDKRKVSVG